MPPRGSRSRSRSRSRPRSRSPGDQPHQILLLEIQCHYLFLLLRALTQRVQDLETEHFASLRDLTERVAALEFEIFGRAGWTPPPLPGTP